MSSTGSVTHWISLLKAGNHAAAQPLWERYYRRLVGLAYKKLQGLPRRAADEEDVVLSAFDSFCRGAEGGKFPRLVDRDDLWQLLVVITARKACDLVEYEHRQKRGGGKVLGESALAGADSLLELEPGMEQVIGNEPTPEFAAQVAEECQRLLDQLDDPELRSIALWRLEGYTNKQIAEKLSCVPRTVKRKLDRIHYLWEKEHAG
jgi:DNA-directed RNA polymerase specialized sigma24 family protein